MLILVLEPLSISLDSVYHIPLVKANTSYPLKPSTLLACKFNHLEIVRGRITASGQVACAPPRGLFGNISLSITSNGYDFSKPKHTVVMGTQCENLSTFCIKLF